MPHLLRFPALNDHITLRSGGHYINPSLFVQLKSESSLISESSRQNASYTSDVRTFQLFEKPSRRSVRSIICRRDVEWLDNYSDQATFKEQVKPLEVWRKDMPGQAAVSSREASPQRLLSAFLLGELFLENNAYRREQIFQLSEDVGLIVLHGVASHPYRTVKTTFDDPLNRYPDQ